jgi:hypothetical protein
MGAYMCRRLGEQLGRTEEFNCVWYLLISAGFDIINIYVAMCATIMQSKVHGLSLSLGLRFKSECLLLI